MSNSRYTVNFDSYNSRRFSRPWIAVITAWPVGGRPTLAWGGYLGSEHGGTLEIEAVPGSVIRYGQKDGRGNGGINRWAIALADGSLLYTDEQTAAAVYRSADRETMLSEMVVRRDRRQALNAAHEAWMDTQREGNVQGWTFSPEYKQRTADLKSALEANQ